MHTGFTVFAAAAMAALGVVAAPAAEAPAAVAASTLKAEMQPLAFFVGQWECAGEFTASKKPTAAHVGFTSDLDGSWLAMRWDDRAPGVFHALEMWGFDKAAQRFTSFVYDNFGGARRFAAPGWAADTWVWTADALTSPAAAPAAPAAERFVFERQGAERFVVRWQVRKPGGDWTTGDELTCKR